MSDNIVLNGQNGTGAYEAAKQVEKVLRAQPNGVDVSTLAEDVRRESEMSETAARRLIWWLMDRGIVKLTSQRLVVKQDS